MCFTRLSFFRTCELLNHHQSKPFFLKCCFKAVLQVNLQKKTSSVINTQLCTIIQLKLPINPAKLLINPEYPKAVSGCCDLIFSAFSLWKQHCHGWKETELAYVFCAVCQSYNAINPNKDKDQAEFLFIVYFTTRQQQSPACYSWIVPKFLSQDCWSQLSHCDEELKTFSFFQNMVRANGLFLVFFLCGMT